MTIPFPPPAFDHWTGTVSLYLERATGRCLADLPLPESVLREWHGRGWAAREVAERLVDRAAKVRRVRLVSETTAYDLEQAAGC
jgi:hypothetical protein